MTAKTIEIKDLEATVFEMRDQIFGILAQYDIPMEWVMDITDDISQEIADILGLA